MTFRNVDFGLCQLINSHVMITWFNFKSPQFAKLNLKKKFNQ